MPKRLDPNRRPIAIRIVALSLFFSTMMFIGNACLRGAGDACWPMLINGFSVWVVRMSPTALFALVLDMGLLGAWLAPDLTARYAGLSAFPPRGLEERVRV